jgi:hypothetical protein
MDKRLAKRHKRQVSRAKDKIKLSEPDLRTHEQIEAARELSRPDTSHGYRSTGAASRPVPPPTADPEKTDD